MEDKKQLPQDIQKTLSTMIQFLEKAEDAYLKKNDKNNVDNTEDNINENS